MIKIQCDLKALKKLKTFKKLLILSLVIEIQVCS